MSSSLSYKLQLDLQCGECEALIAGDPSWEPQLQAGRFVTVPKFCPRCSAALERYCLACRKRAPMFFEDWWPNGAECVRTYGPARHCPDCRAGLGRERETA